MSFTVGYITWTRSPILRTYELGMFTAMRFGKRMRNLERNWQIRVYLAIWTGQ